MRYFVFLVLLFVMNGCAINRLFLSDEIDKVNVVKYTPYVKHHRAYFTRTNLKPMFNNRKYLFLYSPKQRDLALLLRRNKDYLLYSFSKPENPAIKFKSKGKISKNNLLRSLRKAGYRIANLTRLGFDAKIGLRRYKGVKTLMVEIKDYRNLKRRYESAIKHYQAAKVLRIKTPLLKKFIYSYLIYYYKRAKTPAQRKQLELIANKLQIRMTKHKPVKQKTNKPISIQSTKKHTKAKQTVPTLQPKPIDIQEEETTNKEEPNETVILYPEPSIQVKPYSYYLYQASLYELSNYLDDPQSAKDLSHSQHNILKHRLSKLKEEQLLQEGSLETLIAAYKKNKDPRFKQRILELMKEKQEEDSSQ